MNRQELMNECDLLQGNINRMMVTSNQEELFQMFGYASMRLSNILAENRKRLMIEESRKRNARKAVDNFDWENELVNG